MTDATFAPPGVELRATLAGDGAPGPIEERAGRRLIRLVDPSSDEGTRLLYSGDVSMVGPGGESFGRISVEEAWRRLRARLEALLADEGGPEEESIREGLERLRRRAEAPRPAARATPPRREGRA